MWLNRGHLFPLFVQTAEGGHERDSQQRSTDSVTTLVLHNGNSRNTQSPKKLVISGGTGTLPSLAYYHVNASFGHIRWKPVARCSRDGVQSWTPKATEVTSPRSVAEAEGAVATTSEEVELPNAPTHKKHSLSDTA